jgi:hypothetical protein
VTCEAVLAEALWFWACCATAWCGPHLC